MRRACFATIGRICGLICFGFLAGCTTFISSKPATEDAKGFRYPLPIPVLQVVPQKDGTIVTDVIYIADPENTYVYNARSIVSSYTLQVEREPNGLLKKVTMDAKSADVAAEVAKATGEVAKSEIDAAKEEAKAEKEEKESQEKAAKEARQTIRDKELAVAKAAEKVKLLEEAASNPPTADEKAKIFEASLELRLAEVERDAAIANATEDFGDLLDEAVDIPAGGPVAYGPVYYRIVMEESSVSLMPLVYLDGNTPAPTTAPVSTDQKPFPTSTDAIPKQKVAAAAVPTLFLDGDAVIVADDNDRFKFEVKVENAAIKQLEPIFPLQRRVGDVWQNYTAVQPTVNLSAAGRSIFANFPSTIEVGSYKVEFRYRYGAKNTRGASPITFEIVK